MTLVQVFRVRLRRAARMASQLSELFDFLGLDFVAQLFRALLLASLLALMLLELLARAVLRVTLFSWRFFVVRFQRAARALGGIVFGVAFALLVSSELMKASPRCADSIHLIVNGY